MPLLLPAVQAAREASRPSGSETLDLDADTFVFEPSIAGGTSRLYVGNLSSQHYEHSGAYVLTSVEHSAGEASEAPAEGEFTGPDTSSEAPRYFGGICSRVSQGDVDLHSGLADVRVLTPQTEFLM